MLSRASPEQEKTLAKLVLSATSVKDLRGHTLSQSFACSSTYSLLRFAFQVCCSLLQLTWRVAPQKLACSHDHSMHICANMPDDANASTVQIFNLLARVLDTRTTQEHIGLANKFGVRRAGQSPV